MALQPAGADGGGFVRAEGAVATAAPTTFSAPIEPPAPTVSTHTAAREPAARPRATALLVEDDEGVTRLVRMLLEDDGWAVVHSGSVGEALAAARERTFDVILCDLGLPDGDGTSVLAALQIDPELAMTPVVVLSGRDARDAMALAIAEGAHDYLPKPFEPFELIARCRAAARAHEARRSLLRSQRLLLLLAEQTSDLVTITDMRGVLRYVSPSVRTLLGWDPAEMIGRPGAHFYHPEDVSADGTLWGPIVEPVALTHRMLRTDSSFIWVEQLARPITNPETGETEILSAARDMTARVAATLRLEALSRARRAILSEDADPATAICAAAQTVTSAVIVTLLEPDGEDHLVLTGASGVEPGSLSGLSLPMAGNTPAALAFRTRQTQIVAELNDGGGSHTDPRAMAMVGAATGVPVRAAIDLPVIAGERCLGVLAVAMANPLLDVDSDVLDVLNLLASDVALAIERAEARRALEEQASTDALTGLANRRVLDRELQRELGYAARGKGPLSVALIDIDFFKVFNDQNGHQAGDELLRNVAETWLRLVRAEDTLARYGGEEFALLLPGCSRPNAEMRLRHLQRALPDGVTVSVGITDLPTGTPREVLERADRALYEAKAAGRNRIHCYPAVAQPEVDPDGRPLPVSPR